MQHGNSVMPASRPNSSAVCRNGELHLPTVKRVSNITTTSGSALRRNSSLEIKWRSGDVWILAGVSTKTNLSGQRWSLTVGLVTIGGLLCSVALSHQPQFEPSSTLVLFLISITECKVSMR
jgi:hypothetical protein